MNKLIAIKEAAELLGVDPKTLRRWESDGKISPQKTIGGHRRYLLSDIEAIQGFEDEEQTNDIAIYCRVSSHEQKQKGDLDRQQSRFLRSKRYNPFCKITLRELYLQTLDKISNIQKSGFRLIYK